MSFKDFLKQNTEIDHKFLDEYFAIFDENYGLYDFVIDSEVIREYLKLSVKQRFDSNIIINYRLFLDYKLEKSTGYNGKYKKQKILLSPATAKSICMNSRSELSMSFREYFIEIEKALFDYVKKNTSKIETPGAPT
jgi:phage anti-repressor protein